MVNPAVMKRILILNLLILLSLPLISQKKDTDESQDKNKKETVDNKDQQQAVQVENTDEEKKEKESGNPEKQSQDIRYQESSSGVKRSIHYKFSSVTSDSDPGNGIFRYNKDNKEGISYIYIDDFDLAGENQTKWYSTWDDTTGATGRGRINIVEYEGKNVNIFDVKGVFVKAEGYWKVPVEFISGSLPADGTVYYYVFERIENKDKSSKDEVNKEEVTAVVTPVAPPPVSQPEPAPVVQPAPEPQPEPQPAPQPETQPEPVPEPAPVVQPVPEPTPEPQPVQQPAPVQPVAPEPVVVQPQPEPQPVKVAEPTPVVQPAPEPAPVVQPAPEPAPVVQPAPEPAPVVPPTPEPAPVVPPTPEPAPVVPPAPEPTPVVQQAVPEPIAAQPQPEPVQPAPVVEIKQPEPEKEAEPVTEAKRPEKPQPQPRTRTNVPGQQPPRQQAPKQEQPRTVSQPVQKSEPAQPAQPKPVTQTRTTQQPVQPQPAPAKKETPVSQPASKPQQQQTWPSQPSTRNTQPSPSVPSYPSTGGTVYSGVPSFKNSDGSRLWHGIIEAGYGLKTGDYGLNNFRMNFIGSISLGKHFKLGLGLGYRNYFDKPDKHPDWYLVSGKTQVPVFLDMRILFSKKKLTPFFALGVGGTTETSKVDTTKHGSFINPSAGLWLRLGRNSALFADIAYEGLQMEYASPVDNIPFRRKNNSISLNIGIEF